MDYEYFKDLYKLIAIDLSKQIELENPDLKQQINFIGRLEENNATMFLLLRKKKKPLLIFHKILQLLFECIKMETRKIVNLLNYSDNESSKFATGNFYVINDQNNGQYGREDENDATIKFETKVIKPNLCD